MKYCKSCKINVSGNLKYCPLCQNALVGEPTADFWPASAVIYKQFTFFRIQLFVALTAASVCLGIDFLLDANLGMHWSLIVSGWVLITELFLRFVIHGQRINPSKLITYLFLSIAIVLSLTFYLLGLTPIAYRYIIPSICIITLIVNFVLSCVDKSGNALIYLLCNILVGIIPAVIMKIILGRPPIIWSICLILTTIIILALFIFRGRRVFNELQKRLHF